MYGRHQLDDDTESILDGFTILEAPPEAPSELSRFINLSAYFSDMLSSESEIDPRACADCVEHLNIMMKERLKETEDEYNEYRMFLERLESEYVEEDLEKLEKQLKDVLLEEENLKYELSLAKEEEKNITQTFDEHRKKNEELNREEVKTMKSYSKYYHEYTLIQEEMISLKSQLAYTKEKIEQLDKTNIFDATFHIWHQDSYGTINSFRFGYLPSNPVDWSEINAAWGQTSLLLSALARKMNLKFKKFRLVPFGNRSYIEMIGKNNCLPLYGSGSFKFRWDNNFDKAMVAFLECLLQLKNSKKGQSIIRFPYRIESGRLEDTTSGLSYSIKIQFNCEEHWTKSLKFLVTNLKWALVALPLLDREREKLSRRNARSLCYHR